MTVCEKPDFIFPLYADVYYPVISQSAYGQIEKSWSFDRTIVVNAEPYGSSGKQKVEPSLITEYEDILSARSKKDLRITSEGNKEDVSNVLITNIRDIEEELVFYETSGSRKNQGTLYEIATIDPVIGPFKKVEHYQLVLRKTERQEL